MNNVVNRAPDVGAKKKQFQSLTEKGRWLLATLTLIFTLGIGQMWAVDPEVVTYTFTNTSCLANQTYTSYGTPGSETFGYASSIPVVDTNGKNALTLTGAIYNNNNTTGRKIKYDSSKGLSLERPGAIYFTLPKAATSITINIKSKAAGFGAAGEAYNAVTTSNLLTCSGDELGAAGSSGGTFTANNVPAGNYKIYSKQDLSGSSSWGIVSIVITYPASSDPVDPEFTYTPATYTIGDPALDLSTKVTSTNATGAITFAVSTADAGTTGASIANDKDFTATTAGTATITVSQAASTGYNAKTQDIDVTVVAPAPAVCPSGLTISGTAAYTEGQTISLNAALSEGNGEITYNWYKGADLATAKAAGSIGTGTSFSKASCTTSDAGNYFCVATKATCSDAESTAYAVTVEEKTCPTSGELYSMTMKSKSLSGVTQNTEVALVAGDYATEEGGVSYIGNKNSDAGKAQIKTDGGGTVYFNGNDAYVKIVLDCPLKADDKITFVPGSGTRQVCFTTTNTRTDTYQTSSNTFTVSSAFLATAADPENVTTLYVWRIGSSTYLHSLTITRPYNITFESAHGVTPTSTKGFEVTLAEITGVASWEHTGWTANKDVKVGDDTKTAGTALDVDATVKVSADTKFTATWVPFSIKHTVTYYNGEAIPANKLGEEEITEGDHPTGAALAPRKLGYTFGGWSTTEDGAAATLSDINVIEDMPLYAVWNAVNCATKSGTIYTMSIVVAPLANCTITSTTGTHDLYQYEGVSGGEALLGNKGTSNNCILQTNKKILLKDDNSYIKLDFDCPLKEGDKIVYSVESNNPVVSTGNSKPSTPLATLDRSKTEFVIPAESGLIDAQTIYIWKGGGNTTVTYINIVRPEKFEVTFNMHGHGTQVEPQNIVSGGKVTEPATTDITGWDFGGWYATYVADPESYSDAWDFANDVVSAAVELHAKWTEHVLSNNVALGTLTVNGEDVAIVPSQLVYAVELPFGTTAIPTVAATAADANAKACDVTQALAVDGSATIYVKAEDNTTEATYTINFSVATSKDIQLIFKTGTTPCVGSASTSTQILSNNAAVSTYINQITFTNVEGAGDDGAEGGSLNVGKKAGNMFTLSAKAGYALQSMNFLAKIQDADCEYSINGGAWTTLTSTNTGGDECYAPFSAAEVHEFRLRSTGASGVWIRNMQLTIVEACTPITLAWDEEPVEFEVGKVGYVIEATANNGGTVSYSSESAAVVDVVAATGALTISGLGSAILKAATAEGDGTTYCANGGNDIEISKAVNTYYLVKFDAQNGDAADEVKYFSGDAAIALPAAPTYPGFDFQGWFDAETGGNQYTAAITPSASITVYAQWVAQCAGATITTQPTGASYLTGRTPVALVCEATAGAGGALSYEWFTCEDALKTNPVAATATPSTAVAGTFYYFCKVMEEGCDVEAFSDVVTITVADKDAICLVKAELAPGSSAASITSTSGYYKDDENIAINIKKDLKLGSTGNYVKVAIDGANFQDGDVVEITLASDKTASAWLQIFTDEGTTMVAEMTSGVSREHPNYLTISGVPANTKTLYLYRTEAADGNMNPYPTSMAVYRTCAPILNKVTVAGVDGTPDNTNHIAIEVPFSTLDAALNAIAYDWVSNDAIWTAAHNPAVANAWEWGVENTVTLTDKDNDQSVYYVTISKAVASTDATLSALTVNGQAIALADGVFEYSFELPYGTTIAPTVVATPNHVAAVATVDPCTVSGATITVVPESGAGDQKVYTLTFVISKWAEVVIWDGSTMSAVATSPDATTGFAWSVNGFSSITNYSATCGTKAYTKTLPSGGGASASRNVAFTVPAGYVAKFYIAFGTHSDGNNRGMFIGTTATKTLDETSVLTLYSDSRTNLTDGTSEIVGAGTYYLNPMESEDFYEIRAYVRPGYARTSMLGNGVLGTVCVDHNVAIEDIQGATFYELMGRDYSNSGKLAFDEIISGELEAGKPYVFQAHGDKLLLFYGNTKVDDPVNGNGMYGTFQQIVLSGSDLEDVYYFAQKALWSCDGAEDLTVAANRAYVKLSEVDPVSSPNPAPGRRRITMNVNGEKVVTGVENLNASEQPVKLLINGQIFILRGEKMFDATGRLVK